MNAHLEAAFVALFAAGIGVLLIAGVSLTSADSAEPARVDKIDVPNAPGFPSPPAGAVVFARQDVDNVLALAVTPSRGERAVSLQSSVVGPDGMGVSGLRLGFAVRTAAGRAFGSRGTACGPGCYAASVATDAPQRVTVTVRRGLERREFRFDLPRPWPAADATDLVRRSGRVWRNLRTLVWHERLASDPRHVINTVWRAVAPNRFGYRIVGGAEAVVIGSRRWDRGSPTDSWRRSTQEPELRQPVPFWSDVRAAHVVGSTTVHGHPAWRVTFFDPRTPAWFSAALDKQTLRTLELEMTATAHFMRHVYRAFNEPLQVQPPR